MRKPALNAKTLAADRVASLLSEREGVKESHQCGDIAKKSPDGCSVSGETVEQCRVTLSRVTYEPRPGGGKLCTRFLSSADTRYLRVIIKQGCVSTTAATTDRWIDQTDDFETFSVIPPSGIQKAAKVSLFPPVEYFHCMHFCRDHSYS